MVSAIGMVFGLLVSMFGLADLLFSDEQRKSIDTLAIALWDKVDELRKLSFADRFQHPSVFGCGCLLSPIVFLALVAILLVPGLPVVVGIVVLLSGLLFDSLIAVFVVAAGVSAAEIILRRIAEFPKGSVAGIGVLITFVSGVAKALF